MLHSLFFSNDFKKHISETLQQLSEIEQIMTLELEFAQQRKTISDSLLKLTDLYLKNLKKESVFVEKNCRYYYFLSESDSKFLNSYNNVLNKEIEKNSKLLSHLQMNREHRAYRDSVIIYEKLISISNKINNELELSAKSIKIINKSNYE